MKGIFKDYSAWMQFLILFLLGLAGAIIFSVVGALISPVFFDVSYSDLVGNISEIAQSNVGVLKLLQLFSSTGTFLVPALVAAWLFSDDASKYMMLSSFQKPLLVVPLVVLLAFMGNSVSDLLYRFSVSIPWPESLEFVREILDKTEAAMAEQIRAFLEMDNLLDFAGAFFIMAILPAVGEEFMFRGVVQPLMKRAFGNTHMAIWITAFLFAMLHQQVYAFLSIMALGVVLSYLKEWSQSIWVPVIMHLVNNGAIILGVYFLDLPYNNEGLLEDGVNWLTSLSMLAGFGLSLVALYLINKKSPQ